ncbi:peptidase C14 [Scytonema hofmannii PCC 7110]|uniref:Peptidase C14 n=1 Tax=Scytonema hofmannii PCC 7110 TaxID=128403 RepID=A0A139X3C8_9CYAN|nr:caspase family protein [Scytonema hofmannii]KYC39195.1 peptidase C14 [Scytonema hofmannii PCC 7110]
MANNWAIAIGINQYHFYQPLGYAQADAEAVKDFLVTHGGFLPQQCLLMTDTSPPFRDRSTIPTKENILLLVEDLVATDFQPQDRVWFFFSGYGTNAKGQDYLMAMDGNPNHIEETGIDLRSIMQSLQFAALNAFILLDINRATGSQADAFVGQESVELAKELQIPTILSCQLEEFSYESSELSHGFFTATLLEALRFGHGSSLTNLENYLSVRTPELCQHHWRPTQNPIVVSTLEGQIILPQFDDKRDKKSASAVARSEFTPLVLVAPSLGEEVKSRGSGALKTRGAEEQGSGEENSTLSSTSLAPSLPPSLTPSLPHPTSAKKATSSFLPKLLFGSVVTMLLLCIIAVVVLHERVGLRLGKLLPVSSKTDTNGDRDAVGVSPKAPTVAVTASTPSDLQVSPQPTLQPTSSSDESQKRIIALADLEKMSLTPDQASNLRLAIIKAREIPPSDPLYQQAQADIEVWSRIILELAENRAKEKRYSDAIAAAQLITKEESIFSKAQFQMRQWRLMAKQYMSNTTLVDAASGLVQPGQASTYNRAIEVAKKVPQGQPGFDVAKKSIDTWSEKIFELAQRRATRREFKSAIDTAVLVPEGTAAYKEAQEAIKKWSKTN